MVLFTSNKKQLNTIDSCPAETSIYYLHNNLNKNNTQKGFTKSFLSAFILSLLLLVSSYSAQAARYSVASGNWSSTSTWSATSGGTAGASVPVAGDTVTIQGGFNVTLTANAACKSITFTAVTATSLTLAGFQLDVSGAITIPCSTGGKNLIAVGSGTLNAASISFTSGGGTVRHEITISTGTVTVSGDVTQTGSTGSASFTFTGAGLLKLGGTFLTSTTGTLTPSTGTVEYYGAAQTLGDFTYYNLTLSGSGTKTLAGTTTVTRLLTTSVTLNMANLDLTVGALVGSGDLTHSTGTAGNRTLTIGALISPATYSGILSNGTANSVLLTKSGPGILILSGANTYTGATSISQGTLRLGSTTALGTSSATTVSSGAVLDLNGVTLTSAIPLTLNGTGLAITPAGALTNAGANASYMGAITLGSASTITATSSGTLTVSGTVTGAFALTLDGAAGTGTMSGIISTPTSVIKNGAGTWSLSGANTYTGTTTINVGVLSINTLQNFSGGASSLGAPTTNANGIIAIGASGKLQYTGTGHASNRIVNLAASGGTIEASGSGTLTLSGGISGSNRNLNLIGTGLAVESGVIAIGSGTVTKNNAGTWSLSGANTYTGTTTIIAGILSINTLQSVNGGASSLGAPTSSTNGTIAMGASGLGTLQYTGTGHTSNRVINITNGTGTIEASGSGTLILSGGITAPNRPLNLAGTGLAVESGVIAIGSGTVTKNNAGTWSLSDANTYTGTTTINGGILSINTLLSVGGGASSLGAPTTGANGTIAIGASGTLQYTGTGHSSDRVVNLTGSGGTIGASGSGTLTLSGGVTGNARNLVLTGTGLGVESGVIATTSGTVTKSSTGTWTLSGVNTYTGATTISAGVLSVGTIEIGGTAGNIGQASNAAANLVLDGGTLFYTGSNASTDRNITLTAAKTSTIDINTSTLEITGAIANTSGALTKAGAGTLTLSGTNLYTGATIINNGTLRVNNTAAFGSTAGGVTVTSPGQIDLFGKTYSTETLSLSGAGPDGNGALVNTSAGNTAAYNGDITIADATTIGGDISAANNITLGGTVTGAFTLTKMGGATLDLGTNAVSISGLNISEGTVKSTTGTLTVTGVFTDDGTFTHNGGTVAFTGTSSITGTVTTTFNNLTITSGTLTAPSGTINIAGNYSNSGTFTHNGGTVNFNGGTQSIGGAGSAATTFNNLTISGTLTKTLTKPVTVAGNLTLTSGFLATDATNILTIAAGGTTSGVSSSSFVNGPMAKAGNTAFDFPVGAGTKLGRIGITAPSTTTTFTAQYFNAAPSNSTSFGAGLNGGAGKISTVEYWNLTPTGTPTAKVVLHWESNTSGITSLLAANLVVAHYTSSAWVSEGNAGTTVSGAAGTLTSNTVSTWSPFTFGSPTSLAPLPVKLISFTAKAIEKDALLNWSTATEKNNDHFDIERSNDGVNFTKVGAVNGAGNSTAIEKYSFTDTRVADISSQNVYYRLKQIDFDGNFEYSNLATITFAKQGLVSISNVQPNPFVGNLVVNFNLPDEGNVTILIIDAQGRIVASNDVNANKGNNIAEFNTTEYAKGLYFISVNYKGSSTNYKMLVKEEFNFRSPSMKQS